MKRRNGQTGKRRYATAALLSALLLAVALAVPLITSSATDRPQEEPYVPFVATPEPVVEEMLEIAKVNAQDIVYDLGSGDGRIVIAAARLFGARGVGIEIDPDLVREATMYAEQAGGANLVRFVEGDLFAADLHEATVVTLFLLPEANRQLLPKLLAELRPGTRILSYKYSLGDWAPEKTVHVSHGTVYYWVVPVRQR